MSSFSPGFVPRHTASPEAMRSAMQSGSAGFAPADLSGYGSRKRPKSFSPQPAEPARANADAPKHFAPADHGSDPTQGWDPLDPNAEARSQFLDPIEAARMAGLAEGMAHARLLAREEAERNIALMQSIAHALQSSDRIDREKLARQLRETVLSLVTRLVGETGVSAERLNDRIAAATALLADSAESAILRVNPEDVALVQDHLPATVMAIADAAIERGGFLLESASTIVEEGPDLWIEQLSQAIERVAVPSC